MHFFKLLNNIYNSFYTLTLFSKKNSLPVYLISFFGTLLIVSNISSLYVILSLIFDNNLNNKIFNLFFGNFKDSDLLIIFSIIFILTNFANLIITYISQKIIREYYNIILKNYFNKFLDYGLNQIDLYKNVQSFIQNDINRIVYIFLRFFILFNSSVFQFIILGVLIFLNTNIQFTSIGILFLCIFIIIGILLIIKNKIKYYGKLNSDYNITRVDKLNDIFLNSSLILTEALENKFKKQIENLNYTVSKSEYFSGIYSNIIKPVIEALFITFLGLFLYTKFNTKDFQLSSLRETIMLAFITLRILPPLYTSYQSLVFLSSSLESIKVLKKHQNHFSKQSNETNIIKTKIKSIKFDNCKFILGNKIKKEIKINKVFNNNIHLILGKNGSGKSTILSSLIKFNEPAKGKIFINNINLETINKKNLYSKIFYQNQNLQIIRNTILTNLFFLRKREKINKNLKKFLGSKLLEKIRNNEIVDIKKLSGGQIQKIRLTSAFLTKKEIIILDEPTNHLDTSSKKIFLILLKSLKNKLVLISTNDKNLINLKFNKFKLNN